MKKNIFLTICILMVTNLFATDYYVKAGGNNSGGLSEATAFSTVSAAVTAAADNDRIYIVGSISQSTTVSITKSLTFVGMNNAVITGGAVRMYNLATAGKTISFSGITFKDAALTTATSNGAVALLSVASNITFTNCVFLNNNSTTGNGGALTATAGNLTITNCTFSGNTAFKNGGALSVLATVALSPQVTITGTTFYNNLQQATTSVDGGAAIYTEGALATGSTTIYNGQVTITKCTFFENIATRNSQDYGTIRSTNTNVSVTNSLFYNNKINGVAGTQFSDFACSPGGVHSFTYSIGQWITSNIDTVTNSIVFKRSAAAPYDVAANLTSSNLTWNGTIGKVTYGLPTAGAHTPIGWGSDFKDVGAWDCGTRVAPTFDAVAPICSGTTLSLPTTSTNGVTGTWSPALDNTTTTTYTFTPAVGQCASSTATMTITVNSNITTTFTQVAPICSGASLSALPTTSTNTTGITGTWSPAINNTATTEYTFTPTAGICATTATMTITVNPLTTDGSLTVAEPTGSYTWALNSQTYTESGIYTYVTGCNTATLNLTTNVTSDTPTITSLTSDGTTAITQGCAGTTLVITGTNFVGVTAVTVNGVAVASYVVNSATQITATLPAGAINSGAVVVTTSLGGASTTGGNFAVNANVTPSFTAVAAICSGGSLSALPTTSDNSYTGTWSPALNNAATTEYTFTPTAGQCATTALMTITVNSNVTPTFTQVAAICSGASLSALPTTSNNSITGTWSPAINNAATTEYTFTPTAGQCASTATMTITVNTCPDTFTWNGSSSTDWATAANWTKTGTGPDSFPGQTPGRLIDNVVISNGGTPVIAIGTYVIYSLAINNATGVDTGSILTINSGATLTVNNTNATAGAAAITLKGGSIVNNGTLNATATNTGASFGIACLVPSVAPTSATEYGYSGSGALNISTTQGNASSGGIQFSGTIANTTYKMLFNGTTTFSLNNTALAVYALRVENAAKGPVIIGGAGFTLGTVGAPVNYGLLIMGNNGTNITVDTVTTLTLNSAATNTAMGINILQTAAASTDVNFTNKGTISILGASSNCGINLSVNNANQPTGTNKINFVNEGTVNVDVAIGLSSNNAALRVPAAGTVSGTNPITDGQVTITNTATGVLNLKNSQPFTAVTGCPIRIFAAVGTPAVTITNAGALSFTGQNINFGGSATKSAINNSGIINSSSEFQSFTVTNNTAGTINFNYNTPATTRSVAFTVLAGVAASAGATYKDVAGNVYTVIFTKTGTSLVGSFPLTGTPTGATVAVPASLTITSGTGDSPIAYTAINLIEASPLSASDSAFINNGTVNTGTATNLNTFAAVTTSATSVIAPGGTGVGNTVIANASTVALNGTLKLDIPSIVSSTAFDQITNSATGGGFNITNATLDVTGIFTPLGNRTISILTTNATGRLTGEFISVTGLELNSRWSIRYTTGIGGKVELVYSTPTTWTGTTSTDWATGTNWTGAGAPNSLTDVTIENVTNKPIIGADTSVKSLTLNASASLTVNSGKNLTVAGAVTNNGTITVNNNANLIQTATGIDTNLGSGTAIVKRNSASIYLYDYTLWSSPVAGQKLKAFSPNTLDTRFYTYNSGTNLYNVVPLPATTDFATATGYLIRTPNTWTAATPNTFNGVFTGVLNNGNISVTGLLSGKYYAVGNPYPSTINVAAFYLANPNAGTLYFWRKTNGALVSSAYATRNSLGETAASGGLIPSADIAVGQGFFVSPSTDMTLNFTNAMRVTPSTSAVFLRTTQERSRYWLNLTTTSGAFSQMLVGYMPEATSGVDNSIDGKYINDAPIALTSIINAEEYTIQGRALPFATTDTVPLGFKTNAAGNYTIAIDHVDGLFSTGQTVFLKDNLLNTVVDLSAGSYSFASAIGTFNSRFEVVYQNILAVTNPTFTANSVIAFSANGEIKINSGSTIMELVRVYDLQGRLLVEKKQINASETKLSTTATNLVLLVEITAANGSKITKKIIQ